MEPSDLARTIASFLHSPEGHGVGILVTADKRGLPHAAYMGTIASPEIDRLLTMTAPDSRKVVNILENPQVEWLFSNGEETEKLLYLRGTARVVEDPDEVEKAWREMPDKRRAYFLSYQDVGINFLIFETTVESFEYREPRRNKSFFLTSSEIKKLL